MRIVRILLAVYAAACVFALLLIPASAQGWFGIDGGPLSAVYAILLGMPWTLLLPSGGSLGPWAAELLIAFCMLINIVLVFTLARRFLK